jgi:hypothetical protein
MKEQKPQVSASIQDELYQSIKDMADREGRSISSMVAILLQAAVKERERNKKRRKDGFQPG